VTWRRLTSLQDIDATIDGHHHRVLAADDYAPTDHYGFPGSFF
jgi:hypothetical protein